VPVLRLLLAGPDGSGRAILPAFRERRAHVDPPGKPRGAFRPPCVPTVPLLSRNSGPMFHDPGAHAPNLCPMHRPSDWHLRGVLGAGHPIPWAHRRIRTGFLSRCAGVAGRPLTAGRASGEYESATSRHRGDWRTRPRHLCTAIAPPPLGLLTRRILETAGRRLASNTSAREKSLYVDWRKAELDAQVDPIGGMGPER